MRDRISRGTVSGKRVGVQPIDEAEHFFKCEACGGWFDMRDLGAVLDREEPPPIRRVIKRSSDYIWVMLLSGGDTDIRFQGRHVGF